VGPLARHVEDLAVAAAVLCGHDAHDATSATEPVPDFAAGLAYGAAGLRIGVPRRFLAQSVEPDTLARFDESLRALQGEGAVVEDVELAHLEHAIPTYYLVATAEASSNLARFDGVRYGARAAGARDLPRLYGETRDQGFGDEVKRRILLGTFALSSGYYDAYYLKAQRVRTLIRRDFERAFRACDAVATPTTPAPAFRFGKKTDDPLQMYLADIFTVPANLAGLPALSLPCGLAAGLPVGLQLVGRSFEEQALLRLGAAFQGATPHHTLAPPL
jgi:aspartyl-tRNA(Asn)/glutamyl-tRNA(Gln) amidotransferase subunit A